MLHCLCFKCSTIVDKCCKKHGFNLWWDFRTLLFLCNMCVRRLALRTFHSPMLHETRGSVAVGNFLPWSDGWSASIRRLWRCPLLAPGEHPAASNSHFLLKNIHEIMIRSVMEKVDRWDGSHVRHALPMKTFVTIYFWTWCWAIMVLRRYAISIFCYRSFDHQFTLNTFEYYSFAHSY
jgi:hypothetical protein